MPPSLSPRQEAPAQAAAARRRFPIDQLPSELLHSICASLKPTENAALRLLCRRTAEIGLHHLVPEAHLIVKQDSFARLEALSANPIVAQNVKSLFFEADVLADLDFQAWETSVMDIYAISHESTMSCRCTPDQRSQLQCCPRPDDEVMAAGYDDYVEYVTEQCSVQTRDYLSKDMGRVLGRLQNVKAITISSMEGMRLFSDAIRKAFPSPLYEPIELNDSIFTFAQGVDQTRSLLVGAYEACLKIESLDCGFVRWLLLDQNDEDLTKMKKAIENLRVFRLRLVGEEYGEVPDGWVHESSRIAEKGGLVKFITSAPHLNDIDVHLNWAEHRDVSHYQGPPSVSLKDVVGDFHWAALEKASFAHTTADEDHLVAFCKRHAATLRTLQLWSMRLTTGSWYSTLERLRRILRLDSFNFDGIINSATEEWNFNTSSSRPMPDAVQALKGQIEGYL